MDSYEVMPGEGIGPIQLGMTRAESRRAFQQPYVTFQKGPTNTPLIDAYLNYAFQVFFDGNDRVKYIELSSPLPAFYKGIKVFETRAEEVVALLSNDDAYDENNPELGYSYIFPKLELSLWRPTLPEDDQSPDDPDGRYFRTIGIGIRGYYSQ